MEQPQAQLGFGGWKAAPDDVVDAAQADADKWPRALVELVEVVQDSMKREGNLSGDSALRLAQLAVSSIAVYHGGRIFYLPSGKKLNDALRDQRIWKAYDGRNITELAREFGLTDSMVYRIIADQRKLHTRKIQPKLL